MGGHRLLHCNAGDMVDKRLWNHHRADAAYEAAQKRIMTSPGYWVVVDLPVPLNVFLKIPPDLQFFALVSHPSNRGCLALDSEVE